MRDDQKTLEAEGEMLGELIRRAGPRAGAVDYDFADFKQEAEARWQRVVVNRRNRRFRRVAMSALALAATVGALALALRLLGPVGSEPVGVLELVSGELLVDDAGRALSTGDPLPSRATLHTGASGRAALRLDSGIRVRVDQGSTFVMASGNRLALIEGTVFVDASAAPEERYLDVETELGTIRDIGTVFQVQSAADLVLVQVREGRVEVRRDDARLHASAGQRLRLGRDGSSDTADTSRFGPDWRWALHAAPSFDPEGATLGQYLDWIARETGWIARFEGADPELLRPTLLHGSLEGLAPDETLELVLAGCGLAHRLEGGVLILTPLA